MITASAWQLLNRVYPEIELGRRDALAGRWQDIVGHDKSFAYEVGRMLAFDPPRSSGPFGAFIDFSRDVDMAVHQLMGPQ